MEHFPTKTAQGPNFSSVVRDALGYLHRNVGLGMWMVTRVSGENWVFLSVEDHAYGVKPLSTFRWKDSFCSHMVIGNGPRVAPCADDVPVYAAAPIGRQVKIGAYIGVPLLNSDGSLFGTLCAIDPQPQPESICTSLPLVEFAAGMLSAVLSAEVRAAEMARKAEQAYNESEIDGRTGLFNRRGWDRLLQVEEARSHRYGHPACVISIDLHHPPTANELMDGQTGEDLIVHASSIVKGAIRISDAAARVGVNDFLVLGVECQQSGADAIVERLGRMLAQAGLDASVRIAKLIPSAASAPYITTADSPMFKEKRRNKTPRPQIHVAV